MSVVIAKKYKNGFILGADSGCFEGQTRTEAEKVFKLHYYDDVYIGGVGSLVDVQRIKYMENLIDPNAIKRDMVDEKSIITYTVPSLMKQLGKYASKANRDSELWSSEIIIVRKDKAFLVDSSFCVQEIKDFKAIGAPEDFCKGAHRLLLDHPYKKINNNKSYRYYSIPEERSVIELIKMTFIDTIYTYYPIRYINTGLNDKEFQVIKGGLVEFPPEVGDSVDN